MALRLPGMYRLPLHGIRRYQMMTTRIKESSVQTRRTILATLLVVASTASIGSRVGAQTRTEGASSAAQLGTQTRGSTRLHGARITIRLVDDLLSPDNGASVRQASGSVTSFIVEVKQEALSAPLLEAAFAALSQVKSRTAEHPNARVVVYIPAKLPAGKQPHADAARFKRLVTQLQNKPLGTTLDVSSD